MTMTRKPAKLLAGGSARPWAALAVLGVAVLAVAAAMIHVQSPPVEPHMLALPEEDWTASTPSIPQAPGPASVKNGKSAPGH